MEVEEEPPMRRSDLLSTETFRMTSQKFSGLQQNDT